MDNVTVRSGEMNVMLSNIATYESEIKRSLNDMEDKMSQLSSAIDGEVADCINRKFSEFSIQFPTIKENIESYSTDFKNVVSRFIAENKNISLESIETQEEGGEFVNVKY